MKKRILSLVLCAAMLLSMCLFLGAGVMDDTTADGSAETTESYIPAVNFTNVAPFVQANAQAANSPARAAQLRAVSAAPAAPERVQQDALVTSKTATLNADGSYKIRLESYSTGTVTQQTTTKPTDIVLVLDQSGSMAEKFSQVSRANADKEAGKTEGAYLTPDDEELRYNNGEWEYYHYHYSFFGGYYQWDAYSGNVFYSSRLLALKTAATTFVNQVSKEATENNVDHRIAIAGFASTGGSYNNTVLLSTSSVVNYGSARDTDYKDALVSVNATNGSINSRLTTAIGRLDADGDTYSEYGIDMANKIFAQHNTESEKERQRVVVVFTDGYTAPSGTNDFKYSMADAAIEKAHVSKNDYKATVYTIGIFANANPAADIESNFQTSDGWHEGSWSSSEGNNLTPAQELVAANRYMHYVSSNYPNAESLNNGGNLSDKASPFTGGDSYYLSAGDADSLTGIFEKIGNNISTPSIELGKKAQVRDIVSPYFTAPANADGITVYAEKAAYSGGEYTWTRDDTCTGMTAAVNGSTVTVTGFDYDANFVSQTGRKETNPKENGDFHGRRLVVEFNVTVKPEFLGGKYVPTNLPASGVYDKTGTIVENFEYPRVDIPVKAPALTPANKNIYYNGTQLTANDLCQADIPANMDDYVTLSYAADKDISSTEDGSYTVTVTATPRYTIDGQEQSTATATTTASVAVYKPEITYQDCTTDYGVAPEYSTANFVGAEWKSSSGTSASEVKMTGEEPALTYTYAPVDNSFTKDTYVNVTVSANGAELPKGVVAFVHDDTCGFPGCIFDSTKGQFIVHIKVFDLTIKKTAKDGTTIDPNQTFVFKVKNNGNGKTMEVVITGPGEQTIKNLPMGSYTITEDTNWSWKYTPVGKNGAAEPSQNITATGATTVTFENENKGTNWLTSLAKALNVWKDNGQTVERDPKN